VEFFRSREDVLLGKSRETTKRKVLSAIVGGKAITEDHVIKQIQTHQEEQNSKKPKPVNKKTSSVSNKRKPGITDANEFSKAKVSRKKPDLHHHLCLLAQ
jgi:hypothetical protein